MDATKKQSWLFGGAAILILAGIILSGLAYDADPTKWGQFAVGIGVVLTGLFMAYKGNKL